MYMCGFLHSKATFDLSTLLDVGSYYNESMSTSKVNRNKRYPRGGAPELNWFETTTRPGFVHVAGRTSRVTC